MGKIDGTGNLVGFQPIPLDQAVEQGKLTRGEAADLSALDKNGNRIIDREEVDLDDGNSADDHLDLTHAVMPRRLLSGGERTRQAMAAAFVTTQSGSLRELGRATLQARLDREVLEDRGGTPLHDPAELHHRLDGRAFDRTSLAQMTTLCETAQARFAGTTDPAERRAIAASLRFALFAGDAIPPGGAAAARQRQIWAAALSRVSPELLAQSLADGGRVLAEANALPLDLLRERQVLASLSAAIAAAGGQILRVGSATRDTLAVTTRTAVQELLDTGQPGAAAALVNQIPAELWSGDAAALYGRLATGLATVADVDRVVGDELRGRMYTALSADRSVFATLPRSAQALFAAELYAEMRTAGETQASVMIRDHLAARVATLAPVHDAWQRAAAVIADPAATRAEKLAVLDAFAREARPLDRDTLCDIMMPSSGSVPGFPDLEWVGQFAHAATLDEPGAAEAMLRLLEAEHTELDGQTFAPEVFRRNFAGPLGTSLARPEQVASFALLARAAEHPERLRPLNFDAVRDHLLAEYGVVPRRGPSPDPLQARLNEIHAAHETAQTLGEWGLLAVEAGVTVAASAVAPVLGTLVSAGLLARDLGQGLEHIDLSRALGDAGVMTAEESRRAEIAAWVGIGLSVASFAGGELGSAAAEAAQRQVSRLSLRLLRAGRSTDDIVKLIRATGRERGLSNRAVNTLIETVHHASRSTARQTAQNIVVDEIPRAIEDSRPR